MEYVDFYLGMRWDGTVKASIRANYTLPLSHLVSKTNLNLRSLTERQFDWALFILVACGFSLLLAEKKSICQG